MSLSWILEELQSPVAARKSTRGGGTARPLDPLPVLRLRCTFNGHPYPTHAVSTFSMRNLCLTVDLFRLPPSDYADPRPGWTYYERQGSSMVLRNTTHPSFPIEEHAVGNHLLPTASSESYLLHGIRVSEAHKRQSNGDVIFVFPTLGVLEAGNWLLRYRVHDDRFDGMYIAQCFGSRFSVFSYDRFPGLEPATPLTCELAAQNIPGVRARQNRYL
ncbi:Velvet domain-containing protein [Mycena kentingensis (nom. inval.)]|nr:Velvet domain-containing protein [Mycena kentingensis (nom. inval.)]